LCYPDGDTPPLSSLTVNTIGENKTAFVFENQGGQFE
jgi:hypothetical protein